MILTDADQLREALRVALAERDEARAEVAILKDECASISAEFGLPPTIRPLEGEIRRVLDGWKEARAEVERLRKYSEACEWALESEQEYTARLKADLALECREVAERQREACANYLHVWRYDPSKGARSWDECDAVRATPLVTEGKP